MTGGWADDDARNVALYTRLRGEHGDDVRALNWGSRGSQRRRFQVLAEVGDLDGASLLDVGCGLGDLKSWLAEAGHRVSYTGIDLTGAMVDGARERHPDGDFRLGNLLDDAGIGPDSFDYVLSSGIFYFRQDRPQAFLEAMVARMAQVARLGVSFNTLSAWADRREGDEFQADPLATLDFCRRISRRVVLRHDYHPGDFTVYLYPGAGA